MLVLSWSSLFFLLKVLKVLLKCVNLTSIMKKQVIISLETIKGFAKVAQVGSTYSANGVEFTVLAKQTSVETGGKGALITTSLSEEPMRYEALSKLVGLEWVKECRESLSLSKGKVLSEEELEEAKAKTFMKFSALEDKFNRVEKELKDFCVQVGINPLGNDTDIKAAISTFHNANNELAKEHAKEVAALNAIKGKDKKEIANALHQITELTAQLTQAAIAGNMDEVQRLNALIQSLNS